MGSFGLVWGPQKDDFPVPIFTVNLIKLIILHPLSFFRIPVTSMLNGPVIVFQVRGVSAVQKLQDFVGPQDREEALRNSPHSIRAKYSHLSSSDLYVANEENVTDVSFHQYITISFSWDIPLLYHESNCLILGPDDDSQLRTQN